MKLLTTTTSILALIATSLPFGYSHPTNGKNLAKRNPHHNRLPTDVTLPKRATQGGGGGSNSLYLNARTRPFSVNGKGLPEVDFDVGESYSGLLPISKNKTESRKLFFWFFPKISDPDATSEQNAQGDETLTIWLNGGPGCSSMEGLFHENGPVMWQPGTFKAIKNPYSWHYLSNMIWVEQPVGTGYSEGVPDIHSSEEAAEEFLGFFENFLDTFQLYNKKIYITGESYAGTYIPYIADAFYKRKGSTAKRGKPGKSRGVSSVATKYYDLRGTLLYDPVISDIQVQAQTPAYPFVKYWEHLFALGTKTMSMLEEMHERCGYNDLMNKFLTFPPPKELMPPSPNYGNSTECDIFDTIYNATVALNPCFNVYEITTTCPLSYDNLGFPGSTPFIPAGAVTYFNRTDVKKALHVPLNSNWELCSSDDVFVNGTDTADPTIWNVLPRVIEKSERTVIAHGMLDFVLMANGTLLSIQNMTWSGMRGFQQEPEPESLILNEPYSTQHGIFGRVHNERGLTYVEVEGSGHMGPAYQPVVAYKIMEYLLGRRKDL